MSSKCHRDVVEIDYMTFPPVTLMPPGRAGSPCIGSAFQLPADSDRAPPRKYQYRGSRPLRLHIATRDPRYGVDRTDTAGGDARKRAKWSVPSEDEAGESGQDLCGSKMKQISQFVILYSAE